MKRILIISTNAIGDTYISMSAIPVLRNAFSEAEIFFLVQKGFGFLFENAPVKKIITVQKTFSDLLNTKRTLENYNFDFVFSFFPGITNTFFLKQTKAGCKGGVINYIRRAQWFDRNQTGAVYFGSKKQKYFWDKTRNYLDLVSVPLQLCGIKFANLQKYKLYEINKKTDSIVIHPFSRDKERSLSFEQIQKLIEYFNTAGKKIIFIGDQKISLLKEKMIGAFETMISPDIKTLIELVNCNFFIGVDSFPLHIADAYNTNFVGLFSATLPNTVLTNFEKSIKFNKKNLTEINPQIFVAEIIKQIKIIDDQVLISKKSVEK